MVTTVSRIKKQMVLTVGGSIHTVYILTKLNHSYWWFKLWRVNLQYIYEENPRQTDFGSS